LERGEERKGDTSLPDIKEKIGTARRNAHRGDLDGKEMAQTPKARKGKKSWSVIRMWRAKAWRPSII
jgi:hypothetical protein